MHHFQTSPMLQTPPMAPAYQIPQISQIPPMAQAFPLAPASHLPVPADEGEGGGSTCPHQRFFSGGPVWGGAAPSLASCWYPEDEPGLYCALTCALCSEYPPDCPAWQEVAMVCPACLESGACQNSSRQNSTCQNSSRPDGPTFREQRLLARNGRYFCPECCESYASLAEVAATACNCLRDALDDVACLAAALREKPGG